MYNLGYSSVEPVPRLLPYSYSFLGVLGLPNLNIGIYEQLLSFFYSFFCHLGRVGKEYADKLRGGGLNKC